MNQIQLIKLKYPRSNESRELYTFITRCRAHAINVFNSYLFVDLNGFVIIFKLRSVLCDFQKTLVCGGITFLAAEIVRSLLVVMYCALQVHCLALIDLGYTLVVLSRHRETAHVGINLDGFQQAADRLCESRKAKINYVHLGILRSPFKSPDLIQLCATTYHWYRIS